MTHTIIKEEQARRQQYRHQQQQEERSSKAYKLFSAGKRLVQVAIILNLRELDATKLYREYWRLKRMDILNLIYKETNGKLGPFLKLYRLIKEKGMSIEQVANAVEIAIHNLPHMKTLYIQAKEEAEKMQRTIQRLANDIEARKHKISILDNIAFSCEQDCRRKHQEIQELIAQKNRIEKLIANILNGEGYSKLNQIVKENVKAVLAENKQVISVSFAAVIQTLKDDPQIVKLIQNTPGANDGEQHTDDNNNIAKYLGSNKDRILALTEKNYENLVQALTNNAIDTASSNATLSIPHSSLSMFSNLSNQIDTYKIEKSKNYHNNKGDIDD